MFVSPNPNVITAQVELVPDDEFFLLACDGLWDVMTSQVSHLPNPMNVTFA